MQFRNNRKTILQFTSHVQCKATDNVKTAKLEFRKERSTFNVEKRCTIQQDVNHKMYKTAKLGIHNARTT